MVIEDRVSKTKSALWLTVNHMWVEILPPPPQREILANRSPNLEFRFIFYAITRWHNGRLASSVYRSMLRTYSLTSNEPQHSPVCGGVVLLISVRSHVYIGTMLPFVHFQAASI